MKLDMRNDLFKMPDLLGLSQYTDLQVFALDHLHDEFSVFDDPLGHTSTIFEAFICKNRKAFFYIQKSCFFFLSCYVFIVS